MAIAIEATERTINGMATRIAIIEDDSAIAKMYQLKFTAAGYTVEIAQNGLLGLELIKSFKPKVILLDIMMPQMGGVEMLTKLRETPEGKKIKVLILTNIGEQEVPPELKKLDVAEIVMKAYEVPANVVKKVEDLLK